MRHALLNLKWPLVILFSLLITLTATASDALKNELSHNLSSGVNNVSNYKFNLIWQPISKGSATWMWMDIYEANLYATQPVLPIDFLTDEVPLKLSLCYLKSISPDVFIKGAMQVLPEDLSPAMQAEVNRLHDAYQSVKPGDCYDLEYAPHVGTQLKLNSKVLFHSNVADFKAVYFGIWLGSVPISQSLKLSLVGK